MLTPILAKSKGFLSVVNILNKVFVFIVFGLIGIFIPVHDAYKPFLFILFGAVAEVIYGIILIIAQPYLYSELYEIKERLGNRISTLENRCEDLEKELDKIKSNNESVK